MLKSKCQIWMLRLPLPPLAKGARSGAPGKRTLAVLAGRPVDLRFAVPTFTKDVKVGQPWMDSPTLFAENANKGRAPESNKSKFMTKSRGWMRPLRQRVSSGHPHHITIIDANSSHLSVFVVAKAASEALFRPVSRFPRFFWGG